MSPIEQDHIVDAYTFELGKVDVPNVVERMVTRLSFVDGQLAARVCFGLGLPVPPPQPTATAEPSAAGVDSSPALAMVTVNSYPPDGRVVHILANDGCDLAGIRALKEALFAVGATPHVIATHKGAITGTRRTDELTVDRSFHTASSAEADAVVVAAGAGLSGNPAVLTYVQSAYRHCKLVGAWGDGAALLQEAGINPSAPGVVTGDKGNRALGKNIATALTRHRFWDRLAPHPSLAAVAANKPRSSALADALTSGRSSTTTRRNR